MSKNLLISIIFLFPVLTSVHAEEYLDSPSERRQLCIEDAEQITGVECRVTRNSCYSVSIIKCLGTPSPGHETPLDFFVCIDGQLDGPTINSNKRIPTYARADAMCK
ncbi:MAG: hypothetical protein HOE90_18750 [Bacteriovoracaceae bacterium]|nr:hypothetical protein [Bacteriovoracaceae bacterium]